MRLADMMQERKTPKTTLLHAMHEVMTNMHCSKESFSDEHGA